MSEWLERCHYDRCGQTSQSVLQCLAGSVLAGLRHSRPDLGVNIGAGNDQGGKCAWLIFEVWSVIGASLGKAQSESPSAWDVEGARSVAHKAQIGSARDRVSYLQAVLERALREFIVHESLRPLRMDSKLRTSGGRPIRMESLDAHDASQATLPCLTPTAPIEPKLAAAAEDWAEAEFRSLTNRRKHTVAVGLVARARALKLTGSRVMKAAGVQSPSSVCSALQKYLQRIRSSRVIEGSDAADQQAARNHAMLALVHKLDEWATENALFSTDEHANQ